MSRIESLAPISRASGAFEKAFPDIKLVVVSGVENDLERRFTAERRAGKYLVDVFMVGVLRSNDFKQAKYLDPIKQVLLLPEEEDDMAITGPVVVRTAEGLQWQASHREADIGAVSTRPSTLFGFADKDAGISLRASFWTSTRDFHSPRHKHTFDQVRYILSGAVKYGRDVYGPETCLYLPEGVPYGPMQSYENSVRISVGLQFPGPSRIPYPTSAEIANAREELSKLGTFEKGIFAWADGRKQDSFEAIAERLMGEALSYPAPRYKDYVVMNAENYTWQALAEAPGVFVKHLGYFNEVGPNLKMGLLHIEWVKMG